MAGLFVRLKLRLMAGNLRGDPLRAFGFVCSLLLAGVVAVGGLAAMVTLAGQPDAVAADQGVVAFTSLFAAWIFLPLLAFGQDETLDPARLALFPLPPRRLGIGLFAASAVGPWPAVSLAVLGGGVVGIARSPSGVGFGVVAVPLLLALCIVTSRLVTTLLAGLLRSRRGRDLTALAIGAVAVVAQVPFLLANQTSSLDLDEAAHRAARVLRWTPPGMAADAIADGGAVGLVELVLVALVVALLGALWVARLQRMLVTADSSTDSPRVRGSGGLVSRALNDGPLAAVTLKELRYSRRDPRRRVGWVSSIALVAVLALRMASDVGDVERPLVMGVVAMLAWSMTTPMCNALGLDGRSFWMNATVYSTPEELRRDFAGRQLALALLGLPVLTVTSVVVSLVAREPGAVLPALLLGGAVFGVGVGAAVMASVWMPYTVPDRANAFSNAAPGQGCLAGVASFVALAACAALTLPIAVPVFQGESWFAVLGAPYGLFWAWLGRRLAASSGADRIPEIVAAVSRST